MFCQINGRCYLERENMEKIYCIIGATSEIGMAYMRKINEQNEKSTILAIHFGGKDELEKLNQELKNVTMDYIQCDLSKAEDVAKAIESIKEKYGSPTHFLHLAARKFEYVKFSKFN